MRRYLNANVQDLGAVVWIHSQARHRSEVFGDVFAGGEMISETVVEINIFSTGQVLIGWGRVWGDAIMVVGASATYGDKMKETLTEAGAEWIECSERQFEVEQYTLDILSQE